MNKDFWWINSSAESSDSTSAEISFTLAMKYRDVSKFKRVVWYWYRENVARKSRVSVSKSVYALVDKDIIWIVEEGRERKGMKRLPQHSRKRKHILLVGLGKLLNDHLV